MLVLSRLKGESIIIADDIQIVVMEIKKGKVRLGISAPADVEIDRAEIRRMKNKNNGVNKPILDWSL